METRKTYRKVTTGDIFQRLTVVSLEAERSSSGGRRWRCKCECGGEAICTSGNLLSGNSKSCGCLNKEKMVARATTHRGTIDTPDIYAIWSEIKARCYRPSCKAFRLYGVKGVYLAERWHDFETFRDDMGPRPSRNHSVEREDGNGPYSPDNCRWATAKEQGRNTSRNHMVEFEGHRMPLSEACELAGVPYSRTKLRLRQGEPLERVFDASSHRRKRKDGHFVEIDGKTLCLTEAAELHGLTYACVKQRIKYGWPRERWFEAH